MHAATIVIPIALILAIAAVWLLLRDTTPKPPPTAGRHRVDPPPTPGRDPHDLPLIGDVEAAPKQPGTSKETDQ